MVALSNNVTFLPGSPGHWHILLKGTMACETSCWVTMSSDFYVEFRNVICGFHIYRSVWTPVLGELLTVHLYLVIKHHQRIIRDAALAGWRHI